MGIDTGWEGGFVGRGNARGENRLLPSGIEAAPQDFSRDYARRLVQLELRYEARFEFRLGVIGALPLAVSQLVTKTVDVSAGGCYAKGFDGATDTVSRQVAFRRHHDRKVTRELQVARRAELLHEPRTELWRTLIHVAPIRSEERGLQQVHQGAGTEDAPVLTSLEEDVRVRGGGPVDAA